MLTLPAISLTLLLFIIAMYIKFRHHHHHHRHEHHHHYYEPLPVNPVLSLIINHIKIEGIIMQLQIKATQNAHGHVIDFKDAKGDVATIQSGTVQMVSEDPSIFTVDQSKDDEKQFDLHGGKEGTAKLKINWNDEEGNPRLKEIDIVVVAGDATDVEVVLDSTSDEEVTVTPAPVATAPDVQTGIPPAIPADQPNLQPAAGTDTAPESATQQGPASDAGATGTTTAQGPTTESGNQTSEQAGIPASPVVDGAAGSGAAAAQSPDPAIGTAISPAPAPSGVTDDVNLSQGDGVTGNAPAQPTA